MFPFKKIKFLIRKAADLQSFIKLLNNSQRLRRSKTSDGFSIKNDTTAKYNLVIGGKKLPVSMRVFSGDLEIFYEVFFKKIYQQDGDPGQVKTIVDLGANIGLASLYFLENYPNAKIIAVEPDLSNFAILKVNTGKFSLTDRLIAVQAAATDLDGSVSFSSAARKYNSKIAISGIHDYEVPAMSINSLFKKAGIKSVDILKMDIEGAESLVFSAELSWLEKVDRIIIEFHDEKEKDGILQLLGTKDFIIEAGDGMLYKLSKKYRKKAF